MKIKTRLLGPGMDVDPYPAYARIREDERVHEVYLRDGVRCWVVLRYDDARAALADPRLSRDPRQAGPAWKAADRGRPLEDESGLGVHLLTREAPDHTRLRKLIAPYFTAKRAEALQSQIQDTADQLIDLVISRGQAELVAEFAYPLSITAICELLGIPAADHSYFRQWTSNARAEQPGIAGFGQAKSPDPGAYLTTIVADKQSRPGNDLISELIAAESAGELSRTELISMIFLLLIAGHENTVALIGNGILALLDSPEQLNRLQEQPALITAAVEEILRYDGPMELAAWRFATEPVPIGDVVIPAGEPVVIALASAHRDPRRFPDPEQFNIERLDNSHLAFGHGAHHCIGAPLGRLEAAVALGTIIRRLPELALAVSPEQIPRQPSSIVRGLHELPVTFRPVG